MTRGFALCAALVWALGAGAAELPSRSAKADPGRSKPRSCEIDGAAGFVTPGGGCVRVGGYVSLGVSARPTRH